MSWRLLLLFFLSGMAFGADFSQGAQGWGFYGEGEARFDEASGHLNKGSLLLVTDWQESATTFFKWKNLSPGTYRLTAWIKGEDIMPPIEGRALWHFYDTGQGVISPITDMHGSFNWRRIEHDIEIKGRELTVWFRLKVAGVVWIDEVELVPVPQVLRGLRLREEAAKTAGSNTNKTVDRPQKEQAVFNFSLPGQFRLMRSRKFYDVAIEKILRGNWSDFTQLEFDIFNPEKDYYDLFVTLGDERSQDYWTQLNYKTALAHGRNHITVPLGQWVGERGSHRVLRPVDLAHLKKFFMVLDPDAKKASVGNFRVDNFRLSQPRAPVVPPKMRSFDFTSTRLPTPFGMTPVYTRHAFNPQRGHGFLKTKFWRVEDAQSAPLSLRGTIGVLDGTFRVQLPPGDYSFQLIWDRLGYWDPSFWQRRYLSVNGQSIKLETRTSKDYLADVLRYENIEPTPAQNPYDLYLHPLFLPITDNFTVTGDNVEFHFSGDATGISLNRLVIWPTSEKKVALNYLARLISFERNEYSRLVRPLTGALSTTLPEVGEVTPSLRLTPTGVVPVKKQLTFHSAKQGRAERWVQIPGGEVSWEIAPLRREDGKFFVGDWRVSHLINQYISPDMNHETYLLAGKFWRPVGKNFKTPVGQTRYLHVALNLNSAFQPGRYQSQLRLTVNGKTTHLPLVLFVGKYTFKRPDFPVGFFGLDPLPPNYFGGKEVDQFKVKFRSEALRQLQMAGFTAFSGLPAIPYHQGFKTQELDELLDEAHKRGMLAVYSYGGQFPQTLLSPDLTASQQTEARALLERYMKRLPRLVHTFSDEPEGYQQRLAEDIVLLKKLKQLHPSLSLGGFGSMKSEASLVLNQLFDDGFYGQVDQSQAQQLTRQGQRWGGYNAAPGSLDDPRFAFGLGLFLAREQGMSHFLDWQAFNNLPYFDLDGRETDVTLWLPTTQGELLPTVRFNLAMQGLECFMKLTALREQATGDSAWAKSARDWLAQQRKLDIFSTARFLKFDHDFASFERELNAHLEAIP